MQVQELQSSISVAPRSGHRLALVADDDLANAVRVARLLEGVGFDVRMVHDGEAAVALAAQLEPDLVLIDLELPLLDGHEVARHIRASPWASHVTLAATSSGERSAAEQSALAADFTCYQAKATLPDFVRSFLCESATDPSVHARATPTGTRQLLVEQLGSDAVSLRALTSESAPASA